MAASAAANKPVSLPSSVPIVAAPPVNVFSRSGGHTPSAPVSIVANSQPSANIPAVVAVVPIVPPIIRIKPKSASATPSIDRRSSYDDRTPTNGNPTGSNAGSSANPSVSPSAPQRSSNNTDGYLSKNDMNPDRHRHRKHRHHRRRSAAGIDVGQVSATGSQVVVADPPFAQAVGNTVLSVDPVPASSDVVVEPLRTHRRRLSDALIDGADAQKALLALAALTGKQPTINPVQPETSTTAADLPAVNNNNDAFTPRPEPSILPGTIIPDDDYDEDEIVLPTPITGPRRLMLSSKRAASSSNLMSVVDESSVAQLRLNIETATGPIDSHRGASTTRSTDGRFLPSPTNVSAAGLPSASPSASVEFKTGRLFLAYPSPTGSIRFDSSGPSKFGSGVSLAQRFGSAVVNGLATPSINTSTKNAALRGSFGSARLPATVVEPA